MITGAARRLGAATAQLFHQRGYRIIVHCNDSLQAAEQLILGMNRDRRNSALIVKANLTRDEEVAALAGQAIQTFGRLDILVNNASSFYPTPFGRVTSSAWHDLIDSNLRGAFFLSQSLAESLRLQRGAIVNLIDIYAEQPLKNHPVYSIAKAGLAAMTRSLALELAPEVRVNGVAPGAILWPDQDEDADAAHQAIIDSVPLGRTGISDDIAEAVYFMATDASYITGEVIRVDGGRRLNL